MQHVQSWRRLPATAPAFTPPTGLGRWGHPFPVCSESIVRPGGILLCGPGGKARPYIMLVITPQWMVPFLHKLDLAVRWAPKNIAPVVELRDGDHPELPDQRCESLKR